MLKIKVKKQKTTGTKKEFAAPADMGEFFYSYRRKIIGIGGICVIIVISASLLWLWVNHKEIEASFLLSQAETASDYEQIVSGYSFTKARPLAMAARAGELFNQGKYTEAISIYKEFVERYQRHRLIPSVSIGLAYCYEEMGDFDEAERAFIKVKEEFPGTVWAKEAEEVYKRSLTIQPQRHQGTKE